MLRGAKIVPRGLKLFPVIVMVAITLCDPTGAAGLPVQAATAWSPFYTAMVNLSSIPAYRPPSSAAASNIAAAALPTSRRAAGYPAAPTDSHPPLQREFEDGLQQAVPPTTRGTLEGPDAPPSLPEVGLGHRRLRRRGLLQLAVDEADTLDSGSSSGDNSRGFAVSAASLADAPAACRSSGAAGCFRAPTGFPGVDAPPAGTMGIAVGRRHAVQVAGGIMTVTPLSAASGARGGPPRSVSLRSLFAAVAPSCDPAGAPDAAAAYDKAADRFVVAAPCGGFGRLLLAVSATPSPTGTWFLFGLVADGVGTALECTQPKEQSLVDYPQIGYNADGLFLTYHSYCPSNPSRSGAVLLALPKYKAYQGAPSMFYAVYTAAEVAAAAGLPGGAAAVRQLQPVVPQAAGDVTEGIAYFVTDHAAALGAPRDAFTLVALANTGALWGYAGGINSVPAPELLATTVPWGQVLPLLPETRLRQPGGGTDLIAGTAAGFWSGGAALSHGQLMLTVRSDVADGGPYSPRPGVFWAEVAPAIRWAASTGYANSTAFNVAPATCPGALATGLAAKHDWGRDYSLTWGSEFARNWSSSLAAFKAASAFSPAAASAARAAGTRAAGVVLDRAARLQQAAATSPAANFVNMGLPRAAGWLSGLIGGQQGGGPNGGGRYTSRSGGRCGCETSCGYGDLQTYNYVYNFDDYCDAGNNQWGPQSGNDMWGSTYNGAYCVGNGAFGLVGNQQYDQCGRWCTIRCPAQNGGVGAYVNPGYRFWGATNYYPNLQYASLPTGVASTNVSAASATAASATRAARPTRPMQAAACAAAAAVAGSVTRSGSIEPPTPAAGSPPLGLSFPAVAVAPNGAAVVVSVASGPAADAHPSVSVAVVDASASGLVAASVVQKGTAPIPTAQTSAAGGVWGELCSADVHPVTGAVYSVARYGGGARSGARATLAVATRTLVLPPLAGSA